LAQCLRPSHRAPHPRQGCRPLSLGAVNVTLTQQRSSAKEPQVLLTREHAKPSVDVSQGGVHIPVEQFADRLVEARIGVGGIQQQPAP